MKASHLLLTASLLANAILAIAAWRAPSPTHQGSSALEPSASVTPQESTREAAIAAALAAHPDFAEAARSGDPYRLREALTRAGFPDTYVRNMITYHLGNPHSPEHFAHLRQQAERPYWQTATSEEELALQKTVRDLDTQSKALAKEVFGGKVPPHPLEALNLQRRYGFLPAEKVEAVMRIDSDYNELANQHRGNNATPEGRERAQLLREAKQADLAAILTPQELELHDLYLSSTATVLRRQLAMFDATEQEFRALYQIRRAFDEKVAAAAGQANPAVARHRAEDQQTMDEQARAILGEARFVEYQRAHDNGYRAAVEIVTHFNLPPANAEATYTLQQTLAGRAQEIAHTAATDRAAAAAEASALLAEANAQLTPLLGAEGVDAYKKTGGTWLRNLERTASAATRSTGN